MDYFDLASGHGSLVEAFRDTKARFLVIAFTCDWLYPPYQSKEIVRALRGTHKHVRYCEVDESLRPRRLPAQAREDGGHHRGVPGERMLQSRTLPEKWQSTTS